MSALDSLLCDVGSAAVAGGGVLDVEAAVRNVSDARAELAALRERVARLEAALVEADAMAGHALSVHETVPSTYDEEDELVRRHARALNGILGVASAYRAAREATK